MWTRPWLRPECVAFAVASSEPTVEQARVIYDLDDYRTRVLAKAIHIGTLPPAAKRAVLREKFAR